jgi:hypothetical protein
MPDSLLNRKVVHPDGIPSGASNWRPLAVTSTTFESSPEYAGVLLRSEHPEDAQTIAATSITIAVGFMATSIKAIVSRLHGWRTSIHSTSE